MPAGRRENTKNPAMGQSIFSEKNARREISRLVKKKKKKQGHSPAGTGKHHDRRPGESGVFFCAPTEPLFWALRFVDRERAQNHHPHCSLTDHNRPNEATPLLHSHQNSEQFRRRVKIDERESTIAFRTRRSKRRVGHTGRPFL